VTRQRITRLEDVLGGIESVELELKSSIPTPDVLARDIAAFANTRGGTIALGIDERRSAVTPVSRAQARNHYVRALDLLFPQPETQLYVVDSIRGSIVCIDVEPADQGPVSLGGVIFRRDGPKNRPVKEDELRAVLHSHLDRTLPTHQQAAVEANIAAVLAHQSALLEDIKQNQLNARSWKSRLPDIVVSAVVGAILGVVLSGLFL
jgi:predicted HTH transcriptional regulator